MQTHSLKRNGVLLLSTCILAMAPLHAHAKARHHHHHHRLYQSRTQVLQNVGADDYRSAWSSSPDSWQRSSNAAPSRKAMRRAARGGDLQTPAWSSQQDATETTLRQSRRAQLRSQQRTRRASARARYERDERPVSAARSVTGGASGSSTAVVAEARQWIGTNPTGRSSLWCARFMNFVLERTGRQGTGSDLARSFASYGQRVSGPQVGAIAVMSRGRRGGHVGVVSGVDPSGNPIIISGNHGRRVAEAVYPRGRIFAYVLPQG